VRTIVTVKGTALVSIYYRELSPAEYEKAQRELSYRANQLSVCPRRWRQERLEAGDRAGLREQARFRGKRGAEGVVKFESVEDRISALAKGKAVA
jgi:hypothetical protein